MSEANENSILEMILRQVKENRQKGVAASADDAIEGIHGYANNLCVDFDGSDFKDNPAEQMYWLDTAIDGAWCFVQYAALLADALDLTEDELLHIDDDDREYPFLPENWDAEVKVGILQKHIDDADNTAMNNRKRAALWPKQADLALEFAQEAEEQARSMRERLERLEKESG